MKPAIEGHKFNDDLLLAREDRDLAARKYPAIWHVLDHPELRQLFAVYDAPANRAKRRARTAGLWAIGLVWIALVIASSEYLLSETSWVPIFAIVSAVCGLVGVVIGGTGILFARRKQEWLHGRLMTERIRQFHFQTFVFRRAEILRSFRGEEAKAAFSSERKLWLDEFNARFHGKLDEQFTGILEDETQEEIWLHETEKEPGGLSEQRDLDPIFDAYRELRIMHQIGYANHQLKDDRRIFSASPRRQAAVFSAFGFICIILVCVIHVGVLAGVFFKSSAWAVNSEIASMIIIWVAIAALAVRAIEDGLQPEREVERYQQYRSSVRFVLERFDRAASQSEKLQIMREMERLVFDEMRNFLIAGNRSRFVM
jgi:FtsH-binding integral membrane protein